VPDNLFFVRDDSLPCGLSGLLASRLADSLNKPVIVVSASGNDLFVRGSGRVFGDFNFLSYVEKLSHKFDRIGGHAQAFGFSARIDALDSIESSIRGIIGNNYKCEREIVIDLEIPTDIIDVDFINGLSVFEPHGFKNEELIFRSKDIEVKNFTRVGKEGSHGKYFLGNRDLIEAIGWNMGDIMESLYQKKYVDIIYRLEVHEYMGQKKPLLIIIDIK